MTRQEIYEKLQYGDYMLIGKKAGKHPETVRSQMIGRRTLKDAVRDAAIELITIRQKIEAEFTNQN
ncbi:MAG: hypothetical protein PHR79_05345 [Bacteroidales bacterium]|nr:hypothetical protein [Bacteroidales bacterium]